MCLLYMYECVFECLYTKLYKLQIKKIQTLLSSLQFYVHNITSDIHALLVCKFLNQNYDWCTFCTIETQVYGGVGVHSLKSTL